MIVSGDTVGMALAASAAAESRNERVARLFDEHHGRLYRLARRLTASSEEARDLVQDTFLRVVRAPRAVPTGRASEEAWLVRVLVNVCRDRWRRNATRRRFQQQLRRAADGQYSEPPEDALIAHDMIWTALRDLPPRRRAILVLHELEQIGVMEITRLLGISAITVRWHLSRGRRELAAVVTGRKA